MAAELKRQKLDAGGRFQETSNNAVKTFKYFKKPHTFAEGLILPCAKAMMKEMYGANEAISVSDNTVGCRIHEINGNIQQSAFEAKSPYFVMYLDESTNASLWPQLIVFTRYAVPDDLKEEFLFCKPLVITRKVQDVFNMVSNFLKTTI